MKIFVLLAGALLLAGNPGLRGDQLGAAGTKTKAPVSLEAIPEGQVKLLDGEFERRTELDRAYVLSLKTENLLQNFYGEAGMWNPIYGAKDLAPDGAAQSIHWGWESPTCQLRGHFLGHWLSAAAYLAASTGDAEAKGKADKVVAELARIQQRNGDGWVASIPEKYLFWIARGIPVWAPHYTIHKTFMGLIDDYRITGNRQALEVAEKFAGWFAKWTAAFSRGQMDDILDTETGGMLEAWADLYGETHKPEYLALAKTYRRGRLFDPLLAGEDPLTNHHANTTIPEAQGAARMYEVTGDAEWKNIAMAYWKEAVTDRGYFATGGQTSGEVWTPPGVQASRLSDATQEHCVVYNMIRLADYLFRWTGDVQYADYIERNLYNGILAQQNPETGMVAYFLPLRAGGNKVWGSRTHDFWCCHGTLVQANSRHDRYIYYREAGGGLLVAQYIPSELHFDQGGTAVTVTQRFDPLADDHRIHKPPLPVRRPEAWTLDFQVNAAKPVEFELKLRIPWWVAGDVELVVNGESKKVAEKPSSFLSLKRKWSKDSIRLVLPKQLTTYPLPDAPDRVAFMDGPVVLAGLTTEDRPLVGDKANPAGILEPSNERQWSEWLPGYRTKGQEENVEFLPLYRVVDQHYTVYFPVKPKGSDR